MSCNCCPPIIFGNGGGGAPPLCVSADPNNALTQDGEGCLYVPESGPPDLSADPCNAAVHAADGLLVPRTDLVPAEDSGPAPVGAERSVVVDMTHAEGCPDTWTVGARLSMISGFLNAEAQHQNLLDAIGQDVPVPASDIVLPEAGVYHVDTDVRYALGTTTGGSGYLIGWLQDETSGQLLTSFTQIAAINSPGGQEHQGGTVHIMTEYTVPAGPRTVRLHLMAVETGGVLSAAEAGGSDSNGATRMRVLRVRD